MSCTVKKMLLGMRD